MRERSLQTAWLSEAHLLAGRMDHAIELARRAVQLARQHKERGHEGWTLRLLAEIHASQEPPDIEKAEDYYRQAIARAQELGMHPLLARCHAGLGKLYRRTGKEPQAREHLATATTMYRDMDMRFWLEQAEAEMTLIRRP